MKISISPVQIRKLSAPAQTRLFTAGLTSLLLAACGGGDMAAPGTMATMAAQKVAIEAPSGPVAASEVLSDAIAPVAAPVLTDQFLAATITGNNPSSALISSTSDAIAQGSGITDIRVQSTAANAQRNVPFTFGQVFATGHLLPKHGLTAKLADGSVVRLQFDVKATHADGSVRHAVISGVLPSLAAGQTQTLTMIKSGAPNTTPATLKSLLGTGLNGNVNLTLGNVQYSASLAGALSSATPVTWLAGPIANEWIVSAPLKNAAGVAHPHLTARFDVRWYSALAKQARVDVVIENNKTFAAGAQNFTYDVKIELAGKVAFSQASLTHYHHARWHKSVWWDAATEPAIHLKHNTRYLIATKAVSNYDQSIVPSESVLADYAVQMTAERVGPMKIGPHLNYMPNTGGRSDIGPLSSWSVMYLLSMDKRAKDLMMAAADGSGSWSIHYRDEKTDFPLRTDNDANKSISMHGNLSSYGPLPTPRCAVGASCESPYTPDTSHQPSMAYLPYLVTGDYFYLEELQFWAAWNPLGTDPGYSGDGQGLVRWDQIRGQAWSLRTLGHAAYITPDTHYMKKYFAGQLNNNLNFYNATYVIANPNQLGVYDGSGAHAFPGDQPAPWQDDFLTWSFGYLAELGFTQAQPILQWKAKYPVGRMTAPGYCWIEGGVYTLKIRAGAGMPTFSSFAEVYEFNFNNGSMIDDNGSAISHPKGLRFADQACGSQAQADWLTAANGFTWPKGQMAGYAASPLGYPANMQPALAVASASGTPNAALAWSVFSSRTAKPNYSTEPVWAIIPR